MRMSKVSIFDMVEGWKGHSSSKLSSTHPNIKERQADFFFFKWYVLLGMELYLLAAGVKVP